MTIATSIFTDIIGLTCPVCGVVYGLSGPFREGREADGKGWYCPNGDQIHFIGESYERQAERLKAELRDAKWYADRLIREKNELADEVMTKAKKLKNAPPRARAGLCQFCKRHFANVKRHVDAKHPTK